MKSILIIENNPELLGKYSDILRNSGYQVTIALNSDLGINLAISELPNLILCNTVLSNIDGFGVLSVLSKNPLTSKIPFVFLNSQSTPDIIKKGIAWGADDFVTKPFHGNQLIRAVEARINKNKDHSWASLPIIESNSNHRHKGKGMERLIDLISQCKIRHVKKKQTLYYESDHSQWLYLLVEGCIKTLKLTADGRQMITGLYKPKSFIGLDTLLLDEPWPESAEATQNSSLYFISKSAIIDLLNEHVELNQHFIKILSANLHEKEDQLIELAYESVRKRLAQVLVRLNKDTIPIDQIDICRDELAGLAGIATETVSRILTDFKERGLIERNGSQIQIIDLDGLIKMKS
ncbi:MULTISPECIES: cyclic nucleotide-binding domain-containing protein [Sphingobacterium]|uniref:cyclic nucleotide-binding domain-containing protein n=1 Tax=Sphingobacterium TaxID=28453 RepID=UPI0013DA77B6|nr:MULTISPECIES: cyclic nucleotide-binding domain-containing protein [unclassified Sphingobacterium]